MNILIVESKIYLINDMLLQTLLPNFWFLKYFQAKIKTSLSVIYLESCGKWALDKFSFYLKHANHQTFTRTLIYRLCCFLDLRCILCWKGHRNLWWMCIWFMNSIKTKLVVRLVRITAFFKLRFFMLSLWSWFLRYHWLKFFAR